VSGTGTGSSDLHQLIQPGGSVMPAGSFTADITAIRERARQKMEEGPVEIIRWLGGDDPTTRRLLEDILADEEEHADDLVDLLGA